MKTGMMMSCTLSLNQIYPALRKLEAANPVKRVLLNNNQ